MDTKEEIAAGRLEFPTRPRDLLVESVRYSRCLCRNVDSFLHPRIDQVNGSSWPPGLVTETSWRTEPTRPLSQVNSIRTADCLRALL